MMTGENFHNYYMAAPLYEQDEPCSAYSASEYYNEKCFSAAI